jgi:hypothetical protein
MYEAVGPPFASEAKEGAVNPVAAQTERAAAAIAAARKVARNGNSILGGEPIAGRTKSSP